MSEVIEKACSLEGELEGRQTLGISVLNKTSVNTMNVAQYVFVPPN